MVTPLAGNRVRGNHARRNARCIPAQADRPVCRHFRSMTMQWTTPTASDFRFGFEITMYVSAR